MTSVYFVRHAQPEHNWEDDRTRPLTAEGHVDCKKVSETLRDVAMGYAISSPYLRSRNTIKECAEGNKIIIHSDERLRERQKGQEGNQYGMFQKRWADMDFHEEGGESLHMVQSRNMEALFEVLENHCGEKIIFGTHGTALSSILNYYDPLFGCDSFLRIIDFMPYIIRLDFDGTQCIGKEELLIVKKEFKGNHRADMNQV